VCGGAFKKKLGAKLQVCYIVIVPRHQRFLLFDAADSELRLNAHWLVIWQLATGEHGPISSRSIFLQKKTDGK
jgi:hypothetical protein